MPSNPNTTAKLFHPITVGNMSLAHRVVLAPLTRFRADDAHVHTDLGVEYYSQRASTAGTLLITEATPIAAKAGGVPKVPGIWNDEQVAAWKKITDVVHSKGSYIYCQLWAMGRAAYPAVLEQEGGYPYVSASAVPLEDKRGIPHSLTEDEIQEYISMFGVAAENAIKAGFDGVEVHGANGYLVDQFLQDNTNKRTDKWGGSIENCCRFTLEVIGAIAEKVGASRTAIRISPWNEYLEMRMVEPLPTFEFLVLQMAERFPDLAYLHVVGPRITGIDEKEGEAGETEESLRALWAPRPFMNSGGYTGQMAMDAVESNENQLVSFGRLFLANPDLPMRLLKNIPLNPYDRSTFYTSDAKGYIDYPFAGAEDGAVDSKEA